jgi:cation diffusion facilitator family transporter
VSEDKRKLASQQIRRITHWSVGINVGLFAVKLLVGWLSGSMALIADGVHSLSDMLTDLVVYVGHHLGSKAPDKEHPYGHGRIETFSAGVIALILLGVGGGMVYYAALEIAKGRQVLPHVGVMVVSVISVMAKEGLFRATRRVAKRFRSSALHANAWHHRSDALSSVAVLGGALALQFGVTMGDHVAAMVVGVMIILVAVQIITQCVNEFAETAVDHDTIDLIKKLIEANKAVRQWHKLRTRSVGREIFVDLHILVDPQLNIQQAHEISAQLEESLKQGLSCLVNITVHIEPDLPELRLPD